MIYRVFALKAISNQKGMIILPVIIFGLIVTIVFSTLILNFQYQQKIQARNRTKEETANLIALVQMLNAMPTGINGCTQNNLVPGVFGTSVAELTTLSSAKDIKMKYPPSADLQFNGTFLLKKNQNYSQFKVTNVFFSPLSQPHATDANSYFAELNIETMDALSSALPTIIIPFYFTSNGGILNSCFSTSYVSGSSPPQTLQDALCQQQNPGAPYVFSAQSLACFLPP